MFNQFGLVCLNVLSAENGACIYTAPDLYFENYGGRRPSGGQHVHSGLPCSPRIGGCIELSAPPRGRRIPPRPDDLRRKPSGKRVIPGGARRVKISRRWRTDRGTVIGIYGNDELFGESASDRPDLLGELAMALEKTVVMRGATLRSKITSSDRASWAWR